MSVNAIENHYLWAVIAFGMLRVLIITYYWPPSGGSGVQRWVKFAKYLPSQGVQPVIYTPLNPESPSTDHSLEADIPEGMEVIKTRITEFYSLYRSLTGNKGGQEVNPINGQKKSWKKRLMMSLRGNLFIPDPRVTWVGPSLRFLKKYLKESPVDAIVTTGPPHSMHLIGMRLHEATGIPWIADFRDPWTEIFYFKHLSLSGWAYRRHKSLEKRVLDTADRIVAVSPLVQEDFQKMTVTPVELITNGFDPDDFRNCHISDDFETSGLPEACKAGGEDGAAASETPGKFSLTHTGLFASDGNPELLWKVLAAKCREDEEFGESLQIRLAGKTDKEILAAIAAAGLSDKTEDLGYLDHSEVVKEQIRAGLLLLPLRKEPEYKATLPGKLFEYLASLRPVLGIGQSDGAMAAILRETGAGETFDWEDGEGMRTFIDKAWTEFREGTVRKEDIGQYSRRATARKMASLLREVTGK